MDIELLLAHSFLSHGTPHLRSQTLYPRLSYFLTVLRTQGLSHLSLCQCCFLNWEYSSIHRLPLVLSSRYHLLCKLCLKSPSWNESPIWAQSSQIVKSTKLCLCVQFSSQPPCRHMTLSESSPTKRELECCLTYGLFVRLY